MKAIRSISLVFVAALALAAMAPAGAAAAEWTKEGEPLTEAGAFEIEGQFGFFSMVGGWTCDLNGEVALVPGDEGEMARFDTANCNGTGWWAGCNDPVATTTVPWATEATNSGYILVKDFNLKWDFEPEGCSFQGMEWEKGEFEFTPDNPEAMSSFDITGSTVANIGLGKVGLVMVGDIWAVTPPETYGFS